MPRRRVARPFRTARLEPISRLLTAAFAAALCASVGGADAAAQTAPPPGAEGGWVEASPERPPAPQRDGRVADDFGRLRDGFVEWWSQPPGPSARSGWVRRRAEERQREIERQEALYQQRLQRRAMLRERYLDLDWNAPDATRLPEPRPLGLTPAPSVAQRGGPAAAAASSAIGLARAADQPVDAPIAPAAAPLDRASAAAPPAETRLALAGPEPSAAPPAARRESAPARSQGSDQSVGDRAVAAFVEGTAVAASSAALTSPAVTPRPASARSSTAPAVADSAAPVAAPADPEPEIARAPDPVFVEPAPAAPVFQRSATTARDGADGFLSDPTLRIGIAFMVGVGLLCLAFLREWSVARRPDHG